jgi:hypothetical protein
MLSLILRSRRYQRWHGDPRIRVRTSFFAAAAVVTRTLARHFLCSPFLLELSAGLEAENLLRARQICSGSLYGCGLLEANTRDFIRHEQSLVQMQLERLRRAEPRRYVREIRSANAALALALAPAFQRVAGRIFAGACLDAVDSVGGRLDFAEQHCRERLGEALAKRATCDLEDPEQVPATHAAGSHWYGHAHGE